MERLGQSIKFAVANSMWKPIKLGRGGPPLSHLFFADDLVLFGEASLENAQVMQRIIDQFCVFSGHKASASKSKIYFSANTDLHVRRLIGDTVLFQQMEDLDMYLGVLLFHKRVMKSTFQFFIDKVQRKLNGYDAKLLSMAGRMVLVKLVLLAILGYFMQSIMIPVGVYV